MSDEPLVYISLPPGSATPISPRPTGRAESNLYARDANDAHRASRPFGYAPRSEPKRRAKRKPKKRRR